MITRTLVATVFVLAQQVSQPAPPTAVPAGQPRPAVPIATTVLLAHPDQFTGSTVSLTAAVTRIYGPTAFAVAQVNQNDRPADVLIVAAVLTAPVQAGSYVTIIGDVIRFDAATLAVRMKDGAPALTGDVVDRYRGKAAIIATSVINSAMTDLAKRLPPPMTPEEEAYSRLMKQVGPAYNTLRQAVAATSAADVATQAAALKSLFTQAAPFWKAQGKADAMQWVDDARKTATAIELAATATNWDAIKTDVPKLQQICGSCHTAYRERLDDGTYRYKGPR